MSEFEIPERRAITLTNTLANRFKAFHGLNMSQRFQLALYHWIKNGRATCPGGDCCDGQD